MVEPDPHVHVSADPATEPGVREPTASTLDRVPERPAIVRTGCGRRVPFARTAQRPESVTCLPCRGHAARKHTLLAEQTRGLLARSALGLPADDVRAAVRWHLDRARRFGAG